MLINRLIILLIICSSTVIACSQNSWSDWSALIEDEEDLESWRTEYESLAELAENPMNINTVTREQLEQLPFLTDKMIEGILYFVYRYGPVRSISQLLGVKELDWQTRRWLRDFLYVGEAEKKNEQIQWKNLLKYGKHELTTRLDIPMQQKAGYADYSEETLASSPNKKYYGDPFYTNLRYRFHYKQQVYAGLTAEKDAGEPFFSQYNKKGYDSYTGYVFISGLGRVKSLALGHYRASFGYGLVINTAGSFFSSSGNFTSLTRTGKGLTKYSSVNESDYLQGAGVTYRLSKRWDATAFVSCKQVDANVDSLCILTLKTDGYHRLYSDMQKKHTATNFLSGCNINYNGKYFECGLTAVYNVFNKPLNPAVKYYNTYYPRGRTFFNAGINYKAYFHRWIFSGETAVDKGGHLATVNVLTYQPTVNTGILVINRYYDKRYQNLLSSSYSQNSTVQNEAGIYIGLRTRIKDDFILFCYADLFHFPYKRYGVSVPHTSGVAGAASLSYSPGDSLSMLIKYTFRDRAKNCGSSSVLPYIRQRLTLQLNTAFPCGLTLKAVLDGNRTGYYRQSQSLGWAAAMTAKYKFTFPILFTLSAAWFETDDYASSVYLYEPNVLYAYSMSSYYGKGSRISSTAQWSITRRIALQMKFGWTHYRNRDTIGTGQEEIQGSDKSDIAMQLRMKW